METYFVDDNNNLVPKDKATQVIMVETDKGGNMVRETFGMTESQLIASRANKEQEPLEKPSPELQAFLDRFAVEHASTMKK